ncbi:MAG: ABC transporter ATP-binding protein [Firmicutes bacterium]|nr:ABC transporter ATP-binding protein [Bacillota bacterium]
MTHDTPPLLTVDNLGHRAGSRWLIRRVTFSLNPGFTALIGPNGAGKSTLMRTLAGLLTRDEGRIGSPWIRSAKGIHRRIGYIPQFPGVYQQLTVRQSLLRTAVWDEPTEWRAIHDKVDAIIDRLNLAALADRRGSELHPSERRRLALASVWLRRVLVVLLDEPTAGLDPEERLQFWQDLYWLRTLPESPRGYLVTTHLLAEVERYCDTVVVLEQGRVTYQEPVGHFIYRAAGHTFYAPDGASGPGVWHTGRVSAEGSWVVSLKAAPAFIPRPPDLVDAYLWVRNAGAQEVGTV